MSGSFQGRASGAVQLLDADVCGGDGDEAGDGGGHQAMKVLEKAAAEVLKLPKVQSYALCDEPHEVAECKAFADAMYQRITGKRYRSHVEVAEEKAAKAAASSSGVGGVGK